MKTYKELMNETTREYKNVPVLITNTPRRRVVEVNGKKYTVVRNTNTKTLTGFGYMAGPSSRRQKTIKWSIKELNVEALTRLETETIFWELANGKTEQQAVKIAQTSPISRSIEGFIL